MALANSILDGARKMYGADLVSFAVFGSVARGTARPDSDIDILIVAKNLPDGRMNRIRDFTRNEGLIRKPPELKNTFISPVIKTPDEVKLGSPLFWDMTE
jgi:predicted nucleotidyltransferase